MEFTVRAVLTHPDVDPQEVELRGDGTLRDASGMLLQAVATVQTRVGTPSSFAELIASRGMFEAMADMLDELGVGPGQNDGMFGVTQRLSMLGNEVRQLRATSGIPDVARQEQERRIAEVTRERDTAWGKIRAQGTVINEVRRRLNVSPETRDVELAPIIGDLIDATRGVASSYNEWRLRIGERALAELGSDEVARVVPSPTAEFLAQAIHKGRSAAGLDVVTSWENLSSQQRAKNVAAADYALRRIEDAEPRREADPEHLAHAMFTALLNDSVERGEISLQNGEPNPDIRQSSLYEWDPARSSWQRRLVAMADKILKRLVVVPSQTLLPVSAEELGRAMYESGPHATPWTEVRQGYVDHAQRVLDSLPSFTALKAAPPVSAEQLARALHEARCDASMSGQHRVVWLPLPWGELDGGTRDYFAFMANGVLGRLPQISSGDADSGESFVARMDAVTSQLRQEIAELRAANAVVAKERDAALGELHKAGEALGMSFGNAADVDAIGMIVREAALQRNRECKALAASNRRVAEENRQLIEAGNDANSDMHAYRGKVMFVADQLGIPAERVDGDALLFGEAFRAAIGLRSEGADKLGTVLLDMRGMPGFALGNRFIAEDAVTAIEYLRERLVKAEARPVVSVCAPDPEDWQVLLTPVGGSRVDGSFRSGDTLELRGAGVFTATLDYTGSDPQRPPGGLLLPSVTPEQLGRAWFDADLDLGITWEDMPADVQQAYGFHAKRVIDRLMGPALAEAAARGKQDVDWDAVARSVRKPGMFFVRDESGEVMQGRAFRLLDPKEFKNEEAFRAAFTGDMFGRSFKIDDDKVRAALTGDTADAGRELSVESVLSQLREQGEELRSSQRKLERARAHHKMLAEALGLDESSSPSALLHEIEGMHVRLDDFATWEAEVARELGVTSYTGRQALSGVARRLDDFERKHKGCVGQAELIAELAEAVGAPEGATWESLLNTVRGAVAQPADVEAVAGMRRVLGLPADTRAGEVVCAIKELRDSVVVPGHVAEPRRIKGAIETLTEAAGLEVTGPADVAVQKAGDAAAILRSWPDVVRGVGAFDGDEVEQPDEVEPTLQGLAKTFHERERYVRLVNSLEGALAAHFGDKLRPDLDTMWQRVDDLVKRLFAVVVETGRAHGLHFAMGDSKPAFADMVLMNVRNAVAFGPLPMTLALVDQVASRLERLAELAGDADDAEFMVVAEDLPLHRHTLKQAASVVREYTAALASGEHPHPLVMALQANTFWALGVDGSDLELVPDGDGGVMLREETSEGGPFRLLVAELAPVGAGLLMLAAFNARVASLSAKIAEKLPEVEKAAESGEDTPS